jgi:hypothetical protein
MIGLIEAAIAQADALITNVNPSSNLLAPGSVSVTLTVIEVNRQPKGAAEARRLLVSCNDRRRNLRLSIPQMRTYAKTLPCAT